MHPRFLACAALLVAAGCSSSTTPTPTTSSSSSGGSTSSSSGSSGSTSSSSGSTSGSSGAQTQDTGELGDTCPCGVSPGETCQNIGTGSGCVSGLTCFGTVDPGPVNNATCTKTCTQDPTHQSTQGDCPSGFACSDFIIDEVDSGNWCVKN